MTTLDVCVHISIKGRLSKGLNMIKLIKSRLHVKKVFIL